MIKTFMSSLLSRKFLLALAAGIVCVANQDYTALAAVLIGYFGANVAEGALPTKV